MKNSDDRTVGHRIEVIRDGPRRHDAWSADMRRVRDSAFPVDPLPWFERLWRRRRRLHADRYPVALTRRPCWTVLGKVDGKVVGYAWAYLFDDDDPTRVYVDDVGVHARYQGQGVGTAMIADLVVWLHDAGVVVIRGCPTDGRMANIFAKHGIEPLR